MSPRNALLACALVALATSDADARRHRGGGERYVANGVFGAGLELGTPTGLNGKYFLSDDGALNFGIGWLDDYYRDRYDNGGAHLYFDYLWHPVSLTNNSTFQLPLFIGVGGRLWSFGDDRDDYYAFGVRVPFGLAFDFNNVPIDIFAAFCFDIDFYRGYRRRADVDLEFSFGIRYWFD